MRQAQEYPAIGAFQIPQNRKQKPLIIRQMTMIVTLAMLYFFITDFPVHIP